MSAKRGKPRPKSKAAEVTAQRRATRDASAAPKPVGREGRAVEKVEFEGGGGLLTGMRSGFKQIAGAEPAKKQRGWLNVVLWIAVVALILFMFGRAFQ